MIGINLPAAGAKIRKFAGTFARGSHWPNFETKQLEMKSPKWLRR
jgi:hypothetical protein